jgi:hypothetical protein
MIIECEQASGMEGEMCGEAPPHNPVTVLNLSAASRLWVKHRSAALWSGFDRGPVLMTLVVDSFALALLLFQVL